MMQGWSLDGWRVAVHRPDPLMRTVRFFVWRAAGSDGSVDVLAPDGTVTRYHDQTAEPPDEAGFALPVGAWQSLCEQAAAESHLGAENKVLRETLAVERARVDKHWEILPP